MTDLQKGLDEQQAAERLAEYGENRIDPPKGRSALGIFFSQFCDILIVILAAAAVFSVTVGEFTEAVSILAIMLLNTVMGFVQEYRTERTLARLAELSAPRSLVRRGGRTVELPSSAVVPGDILLLAPGDSVAADGVLRAVSALETDESMLTGEAHPVAKKAGGRVFMGTTVCAGRGEAEVEKTGMRTEMGGIAGMIGTVKEEKTPLEQQLTVFGNQIAVGCLSICALVALIGVLRGEGLFDMILMGLSLAVAAIPEGLPAVVTMVLALSVGRILRKGALIRRLHAVESLGAASVICCDKTGTITENRMAVERLYAGGRGSRLRAGEPLTDAARQALLCGVLCSSAAVEGGRLLGSPTECALLRAAQDAGLDPARLRRQHPRVSELPFDSRRKYMAVTVRQEGLTVAYIKGAPDVLLPLCTDQLTPLGRAPLDAAGRRALEKAASDMAGEALRVLALARRYADGRTVLLGLCGLLDPPRPEIPDAVARCRRMGIAVAMITGDAPETACAVARKAGIPADRVLTGEQLDRLDDAALACEAARCHIFARVTPAHKLRLVRAYKSAGLVTVMTGDGVNDAPAVKEADVGVAMGLTGTEVTKEAAGVVILDDNFATIVAAVREGRILYQNIRAFIRYLLACNLGEVLTVVMGMAVGTPPIFLPVQLLLINLITDGLPAVALGLEPAGRQVDTDPPRPKDQPLLTGGMLAGIAVRGFSLAFCNIMSFLAAYGLSGSLVTARTAAYFTLVFSQMLYIVGTRRSGLFSNPALSGAVLFSLAVTLITIYWPLLHVIFETTSLSGLPLAAAAGATLLSLPLGALLDRILHKR